MQAIDDVYQSLEVYNPTKQEKLLIAFEDMIPDMVADNKLILGVKELFLRGRKCNISYVFISQSSFKELKTRRLNATFYFIIKIPKKRTSVQSVKSFA